MSTLSVVGELKLDGRNIEFNRKMLFGLEKVENLENRVITLTPNQNKTITFDILKKFLVLECNRPVLVKLNGSNDSIEFHTYLIIMGTSITSIYIENSVDNPILTDVTLIAADGTVF